MFDCDVCDGAGEICSVCESTEDLCDCANVEGYEPELMSCPECNGTGEVEEDECEDNICAECGNLLDDDVCATCDNFDDVDEDEDE